ncbi:MAG: Na/Pi cotransporter family protein [Candidatus Melainabacteria bacterium]|nr:Na/Pi cotransporter family protein [Candidatus Melainabacteria bacterium]
MAGHLGQFSLVNVFAVLGGLSVFLLGLEMMSANLRKVAGNTLKLILEKATDSPFIGVAVGTFVTALIQSSSATTSILISFVQSQLMSFERSIAVILGANIGTTITAQIVAFKVTKWSLAIIAIGFLWKLIAKRTKTKNICYVILGLGLIFYGLEIMSSAMKVLRDSQYFLDLMQSLEHVGFGILIGAIFTGLIQSSSASIGIVIGLAMQNLISIEAAVPLILGANIGTCVTAVLASIGTNSAARRVATAHVLFNIGGVLLFAFWVPQFIDFIKYFTPAGDTPRLVANAQTSFNIIATLIWFPFIKQLEFMARKLVPDDKTPQRSKYVFPRVSALSKSADLLMIHSTTAIKEYKNTVKEMLWLSRDYFIRQEDGKIEAITKLREHQQEQRADLLEFLSRIGKLKLSLKDVNKVLHQISLVNEIEHVAFKLESALETLDEKLPEFDESYLNLQDYFKQSVKCFSKSCNAVLRNSATESKRIGEHLNSLKLIEEELRNRSIAAVAEDADDYETDKLNLWVLEFLRSVNSTSRRISQILAD